MASIPLPPWLTREYDYASGLRQTGQVIANNLQRKRQLEIDAIRAAAQAQQAEALERWRTTQTMALEAKAQRDALEAEQSRTRMSELGKRTSAGEDLSKVALELGLIPQSSLGSLITSQEATKRSQAELNQPRRQTADEIQRENIMRLWKSAQEPDEMQIMPGLRGAPIGIPKPSQKKLDTLKELEIAERQAGTAAKTVAPGSLTQEERAELTAVQKLMAPFLAQLARGRTLEPAQQTEFDKLRKRQSTILGVEEEVESESVTAPQSTGTATQQILPTSKKPYIIRTIP